VHWTTATIRIPDKAFLSLGEVVQAVGYSHKVINRWIKEKKFPGPILIDGVRRWSSLAVGIWIAWKEHGPKELGDGFDEPEPDENRADAGKASSPTGQKKTG